MYLKRLKKIQELYQRVQERIEKDRMYEYFLKRSELELVEGQLSSLETARKNEEIRLSQAKAQLEMLQKERSEKQEIATNIRVELRHNQEFVALEEEKKELKNLRALIYFTDGDGIYPRQKPDYETAFVFLKRTDKMKLVPSWAKCLITREAGTI